MSGDSQNFADDPLAAFAEPADPEPATDSFPYLAALNPAQRVAVEALDGPVLVLAGAGTGKTRVLTARLAHLLAHRRVSPYRILAVTFTNKAAREMRERVGHLTGQAVEGWWLGTFHALAARMLRRHAERAGLQADFAILDADDQLRLIRQLLEETRHDPRKWPPRLILGQIQRWKDKGLGPARINAAEAGAMLDGQMGELYRLYQERLRILNACDFGDLLLHGLELLQTCPDILAYYHQRLHYLLVDEYQDTNVAQYLWLRLLAQHHRNICCVGDDDQSIYGWRGAEVGNILRFEQDFPGAQVIRLEQNYRSTGHILSAASALIACNQGRLGKTLWTADGAGEPLEIHAAWDGRDEAAWVGETLERLVRQGVARSQTAVLVRAGFQTREFEERFLTLGLPYRVVGGTRFYERQEIRDALAYLRLIHQPAHDLAFERVFNTPKRGLGPATLRHLHVVARDNAIPLATAAMQEAAASQALKPRQRTLLQKFLEDLTRWRQESATDSHVRLAERVLEESGYIAMWKNEKTPDAQGRLDNLKELLKAMAEFENLAGFLEHVSLVMELSEGGETDTVSLMTLHAAKGLEFDHVFLPGWEEGLFPNARALDENGVAGLEEERRLAYVGLTRARKRAYLSHAGSRMLHGNWIASTPSRFLDELPAGDLRRAGVLSAQGQRPPDLRQGFRSVGGAFADRTFAHERRPSPPVLEGHARTVPTATASTAASRTFAPGQRVRHARFGPGTVIATDRDRLDVVFDDPEVGQKRLVAGFVTPE